METDLGTVELISDSACNPSSHFNAFVGFLIYVHEEGTSFVTYRCIFVNIGQYLSFCRPLDHY